jgi:hypothetical protein
VPPPLTLHLAHGRLRACVTAEMPAVMLGYRNIHEDKDGSAMPAPRREQSERLTRYTGRDAVSLERLTENTKRDLVYLFTRPWSDSTNGIKLSPLKFLEKLAAVVPLPCAHLARWRWYFLSVPSGRSGALTLPSHAVAFVWKVLHAASCCSRREYLWYSAHRKAWSLVCCC